MSERRFLLRTLPESGIVQLSEDIVHHVRVLRLNAGAKIVLFDGMGLKVEATLIDPHSAQIQRSERVNAMRSVTIAVPLLKGDRQDWLVEKLCELGCAALIPITCERSVINELSDNKRTRMERLVEAACKQSGRIDLMRIETLAPLSSLVERSPVVLSPHAATKLAPGPCFLVVGPEGGLTAAEETMLVAKGGSLAALSGPILRAETAAIAAAAIALQI